MRHKVIWLTIGMIALWIAVIGGTILLDFDRVQQSNQATAELEWTFICDELTGNYAEINTIEGGENFIGRSSNSVENTLIDEKGRALSDTYEELESIGDGYVRFESTPVGAVIKDEDGNNKRTVIGVLNDRGEELPKEEAMEILYGEDEKPSQMHVKQNNVDSRSGAESEEGIDGSNNGASQAVRYHVEKGDRKYVGIKDIAGNWIIPPVFDKIEISADQKYAVIKNGSNIGIAVLEK